MRTSPDPALDLAERLESRAVVLSRRAIDAMYADPFWEARYGARGLRHSREDGDFHMKYLLASVRTGRSDVFTEYARWLRGVLVARGMCSLHLADNFDTLAAVIRDDGIEAADAAFAILAAGSHALAYTDGEAAALERNASVLLAEVREGAGVRGAAWDAFAHGEAAKLVSYLADALALGEARRFVDHVSWLAGDLERRGLARTDLAGVLDDLARAAASVAPSSSAVIADALRALSPS